MERTRTRSDVSSRLVVTSRSKTENRSALKAGAVISPPVISKSSSKATLPDKHFVISASQSSLDPLARVIPEDSSQLSPSGKAASSQSKELKRLKQENAQLRDKLTFAQQNLKVYEDIRNFLATTKDEKYDSRKVKLFRAKLLKQERLIGFLTEALETQKSLRFEAENTIYKMQKAIKSNPNPEESIHALQLILDETKQHLTDAERKCRVAFAQLVGYGRADLVLNSYSENFEWKVQIDLTPEKVFQVEEKLQNLFNSFVSDDPITLSTKVREAAEALLVLGLSLPSRETKDENDLLSPRRIKDLTAVAGSSDGRAQVRRFVQQVETAIGRHELEVRLRQNELDLYRKKLAVMEAHLPDLSAFVSKRSVLLSDKIQKEFVTPLDDLLNIVSGSGESIAPETQLMTLFKLYGPKMYKSATEMTNPEKKNDELASNLAFFESEFQAKKEQLEKELEMMEQDRTVAG